MQGAYLINDEVKIAGRDRVAFQQAGSFATRDTADAPAGLLEDYHFLHELLLICVQEVGELLSVKTCIELEETP